MSMLERFHGPVVVAVTGASGDAAAVRLAAAEAVLRERELHLLAGHPPVGPHIGPAERWPPLGTARRTMIDALTGLRATYPDLLVDCRVLPGDPAELLIERSARADVVVVPAPPVEPVGGAAATIGERVAAHAHCPVLVAHQSTAPGGDVLVALDGSAPADPLLEFGFAAASLRGVPLRPVFAWTAMPGAALGNLNPFAYDALAAHGEADRLLAEELAGWAEKYPDVPVHRHEVCAPGIAAALVEASAGAALIVVGARSRPARSPLALGPVTRRLIKHARCPVAVIALDSTGS